MNDEEDALRALLSTLGDMLNEAANTLKELSALAYDASMSVEEGPLRKVPPKRIVPIRTLPRLVPKAAKMRFYVAVTGESIRHVGHTGGGSAPAPPIPPGNGYRMDEAVFYLFSLPLNLLCSYIPFVRSTRFDSAPRPHCARQIGRSFARQPKRLPCE